MIYDLCNASLISTSLWDARAAVIILAAASPMSSTSPSSRVLTYSFQAFTTERSTDPLGTYVENIMNYFFLRLELLGLRTLATSPRVAVTAIPLLLFLLSADRRLRKLLISVLPALRFFL